MAMDVYYAYEMEDFAKGSDLRKGEEHRIEMLKSGKC